ncbi:ABC transporter substrate-binding protein [Acinetobacter bouvetii]|uniref:Glutathione-binding protein GsiB n=1 Tax=Acinetobacter bouvetii TaxID=202951 RepID=A0A811GID1_9GAMM|nr:ABC transporter substrate-binding protein [Acinetobacter bouvetii]CAB1214267.1 Glutathione-binding protein GsiB [Acinetobacter bouvetii]
MKFLKNIAVPIGAVMLLGISGCGNRGGDKTTVYTGQPVSGGTLIYATDREPTCLDPHSQGDMPQVFIAQQFLDSLVSMDEQGKIGPWLAKSWDVSKDGLVYTFHLRQDVHFTDGEHFNAQALKANLDHMVDPKTQSSTAASYIAQYVKTDIIDEYTAAVHLSEAYAPFLEVLAQGFLGIQSPKALQRTREENCESPVGSGPFKVKRWDRQSQITLERNPDYAWAPPTAKHQGPAYLDQIIWKIIPEPSVRFASVQAGDVDVIDALPPESHSQARQNPDISLLIKDRPGNPTKGDFNTTRVPFNDIRVCEAFVRASNVEGALKSIFFGEFKRAGGPLSPVTRFYSDQFEHAQDYNPKRAQQLLDEAGWNQRDKAGYRVKNGQRLRVQVPVAERVSNAERALWEQIQASTKREGFEVNLEPMDTSSITKCCITGWDYDIRLGYWNTNTPDVLRIIFSSAFISRPGAIYHTNGTGFSHAEFDKTINSALQTQDTDLRRQLYLKAQKIISENYLQITTMPQSSRLAIYKTAKGVRLEPSLTVPYFYDAWVEK